MSGSAATITELRRLRHAHRSLIAARRALLVADVEVPMALDELVAETGAWELVPVATRIRECRVWPMEVARIALR
ncbi:MAG: hypothetical protein M0Z95_11215 [Actinomycetota bacterium]|nr:hypothetical protein [Actinomycetota bacterium]